MQDVSTFRLYVLRAMYALMFVGLALMIWPLWLQSTLQVEHYRGVVWALLTALSLCAALGIRYPLQMLPILIFELAWKVIWCALIGLPLLLNHAFTPGTYETWTSCLVGVVLVPIAIPWRYVFARYVRAPGDRWGRASASRPLAST
jgi:hypothetical protein